MISTTVGQALAALAALEEIRGQKIPKQKAKELFSFRKALADTDAFYTEQMREICGRLGIEIGMGNRIDLDGLDAEKKKHLLEEVNELRGTETEIDAEQPDLSECDIEVSEAFIEATEGFVLI